MKLSQLNELILQSLEHEKGGVKIYETALKCVKHPDLREDWQEYLEQTRNHVEVLTTLCTKIGLTTDQDTPGQQIVRHVGASLVQAMEMALQGWKAGCRATGRLRVRSSSRNQRPHGLGTDRPVRRTTGGR